jgi:hypothetical protein
MTGLWFSPGPPVSSTNKTDRHNITEILLKVALNIIKQTKTNKQEYLKKTVIQYNAIQYK